MKFNRHALHVRYDVLSDQLMTMSWDKIKVVSHLVIWAAKKGFDANRSIINLKSILYVCMCLKWACYTSTNFRLKWFHQYKFRAFLCWYILWRALFWLDHIIYPNVLVFLSQLLLLFADFSILFNNVWCIWMLSWNHIFELIRSFYELTRRCSHLPFTYAVYHWSVHCICALLHDHPVVDLRGLPWCVPPWPNFFSMSCSFLENLAKL